MHEDSIAIVVIGVVELLLLASLSAVVLRRVRFPYTIGLVIVGLLVAIAKDRFHVLTPIQHIRLRPDMVLYFFLPTLVFPAAVQLDLRLVRQNLSPILLLAGPGVILSTVIVGGVVGALTPLSWGGGPALWSADLGQRSGRGHGALQGLEGPRAAGGLSRWRELAKRCRGDRAVQQRALGDEG